MFYVDQNHFKSVCGYEINGIWYPRVTKIVEIKSKPALYKFYGELENFNQGEEIKKISAKEGTLIHETVENILQGKEAVIDPSIKPAIESFYNFFKKKDIKVYSKFVEKRIFDPEYRYAGTIDALVSIGGKIGILDIKTSQSIYRDYNLQTSAYFYALKKNIKKLQTRWILRIDQNQVCLKCGAILRFKGGRKKIRTYNISNPCPENKHHWSELKGEIELKEFSDWENDFQAFLGAKKLWEWENEYWLKQIGYL